jgi:hypothetical protein
MSIETQSTPEIDLTKRFNEKLANVLMNQGDCSNYYTEFLTLCVFYKKVSSANVAIIERIIKVLDVIKNHKNIVEFNVQDLVWDVEDPEFYKFMTCIINL